MKAFLFFLLFQTHPGTQWTDGTTPVPGTFGTYPPAASQRLFPDTTVHTDTEGGTVQELMGLCGAEGGYSALWRDHRDGLAGLYLARLGPRAERRGPEDVVHRPHAGRRLQPDLVVAPDGAGAVVWIHELLNVPVVFGHAYKADGSWEGPDRALTPVPESLQPRRARDAGARMPRLALRPGGGYTLAWINRGILHWLECDGEMQPLGEARLFGARTQVMIEDAYFWISTAADPLAIWGSSSGSIFAARMELDQAPRKIAEGTCIAARGTRDGALLLAEFEGRAFVRALDARGEPAGRAIGVGAEGDKAFALAALPGHAAVIVKREKTADWRVELVDLRKEQPAQTIPLTLPDHKPGRFPTIAASGRELLVAFTASSDEGDPYMLRIEPFAREAQVHAAERIATDTASSDQINARVAAQGQRGVLAWIDRRSGQARPFARRFDASGVAGPDWGLPARGASSVVTAAMQTDGRFVLAWAEPLDQIALQSYSADGTAVGECQRLARAATRELLLLPVRGSGGWRLFWVEGENNEVLSQEFDADLNPCSRMVPLGKGQRVSAAQLLDGSWICALDRKGERSELFARKLSAQGQPGEELRFEATPAGHDWDASLAPARDGGFLMSWTSGNIDTPMRDVVARRFDARGEPIAPLLWIGCTGNEQDTSDAILLADGSFLVAFEDDLSGYDHALAQRVDAGGKQLGPLVLLNEITTTHCEDRVAPRVAPFGRGFTAVFGDRHRSQGWDVSWTAYGEGFDALPPR